ncbi:hypothetical protein [Alishewanella jeotgali]|uniref:Uncharacterized protein n=1 Tax=Alishewanella jeotgali KCTC 22429 TaxID=1129374 RepID=H3Z9N2_9ALTE|nr:hypothetical protein [Alishewanella jeotgali]EHR42733.1 hypothetical protein AJE_00165 [Alishewanella jeotgali KCTC 22429]
MNQAELTQLTQALTRDDVAVLNADDYEQALQLAVARYNKDKPRQDDAVVNVSNGLMQLPGTWQADFSQIVQAYSVPGYDELPARQLPGDILKLAGYSGDVHLYFTLAHSLTNIETTLWPGDSELLATYAAALCCEQLSAYYSNEAQSTIAADVTQQTSKAEQYRTLAREYRRRYDSQVKQANGATVSSGLSAGTVVTWGSRRRK